MPNSSTAAWACRLFGNVDWKVVAKIGIPGAIGAFAGATFLSSFSTEVAAPVMSLILLALGIYILVRFTTFGLPRHNLGKPLRKRFLGPLGLVAGFVDSTGGGGWGPVGTPAILASGRLEPRKTIGSIDTSEFLVALAASLGFLFGIGSQGVNFTWVFALLIGGVIAAWLVRHLPTRVLGSAVGGIIILTNTRTLLRSDWIDASDGVRYPVYAVIYVVWAAALAYSIREYRANRDLSYWMSPTVAERTGPRAVRSPGGMPGWWASAAADPEVVAVGPRASLDTMR